MTKFKCRMQHTQIGHNTYLRLLKNENEKSTEKG